MQEAERNNDKDTGETKAGNAPGRKAEKHEEITRSAVKTDAAIALFDGRGIILLLEVIFAARHADRSIIKCCFAGASSEPGWLLVTGTP